MLNALNQPKEIKIIKKYLEVLIGLLTGIGFDNYLNKKEISFLN